VRIDGRPDYVRSASLTTTACIVGGIVGAVAVGSLVDRLLTPLSLIIGRGLAAACALAIIILAAREWGIRMSRFAAIGNPERIGKWTALYLALPFIIVGSLLSPLEPAAVRIASRNDFPIHAAYLVLFVPATLLVASLGAFGLGRALKDNQLGTRLASAAGPASALAFFLVGVFMYVIGWRVGAADAGRRATMLVVTGLSATAAALGGGAGIGWGLRRLSEGYYRRPIANENYYRLDFADREEAAAFIAALSRFDTSPKGVELLTHLEPVEVWTSMQKHGGRLYLNGSAFRSASSAFSPVPQMVQIRGRDIPGKTFLTLASFSAAMGIDEVKAIRS